MAYCGEHFIICAVQQLGIDLHYMILHELHSFRQLGV
jgi:hypothetical protein